MRPKHMRWIYAVKPQKIRAQKQRDGTYQPNRKKERRRSYFMAYKQLSDHRMEAEKALDNWSDDEDD